MASSKAKAGVNSEANSLKESKSNGTSSAGEAAPNKRMYCLDELETVATVGELHTGTRPVQFCTELLCWMLVHNNVIPSSRTGSLAKQIINIV